MINPKICPFCKKENKCQVNNEKTNCWCMDVKVPNELIKLVPKEYENKACICKECIELFKRDREAFHQKLN